MKKSFLIVLFFLLFCAISFADKPTVTSNSHAEGKWSSDSSPSFKVVYSGATGYSYELDSSENTTPDTVTDSTSSTITVNGKLDGTYYFHVRAQGPSGWSETTHYKTMIDSVGPTKPDSPTAVAQDNGSILVNWGESADALSGVAYYNVYRSTLRYIYDPILGYNRDFSIRDYVAKKVGLEIRGTSFTDANFDASDPHRFHYRIQVLDNAGNAFTVSSIASVQSISFCDNSILVTAQIVGADINISIDSDLVFKKGLLVITAPDGVKTTLLDGISNVKSVSARYSLAGKINGDYNISFAAIDKDMDICSIEKIFIFDNVPPQVSISSPPATKVLSGNVRFEINASDSGTNPSGLENVSLYALRPVGEILLGQALPDGGKYVFDWNTINFDNGRFKVIVRASDNGGNKAEDSALYNITNTFFAKVAAEQKLNAASAAKKSAADYIALLESKNIDTSALEPILKGADSNLSYANELFAKGAYDISGKDADAAKAAFSLAKAKISFKTYSSLNYFYNESQLDVLLGAVRIEEKLHTDAKAMIKSLKPSRKLEILEVKSDTNTYYAANIVLTFSNTDKNFVSFIAVEPIPKKFAALSSDISSTEKFEILQSDPTILFGPFDVNFGSKKEVVYGLLANLTKAQADSLVSGKVLDFFISPPIPLLPGTDTSSLKSSSLFAGLPQIEIGKNNLLIVAVAGLIVFGILFVLLLLAVALVYYFVIKKKKR